MSERSRPEFDIDWIRAMVTKEEELGTLPPVGASGGFGAKRRTSPDDLRAAVARADEVLGCGAMPCRFKATTGLTTNGRCACLDHPRAGYVLAALYKAAKAVVEEPSAAIKRLDDFIDKLKAANPGRIDLDAPIDPGLLAAVFPARCEICDDEECPRAQSDDVPCIKRKTPTYPAGFAGAAQAEFLAERGIACGCWACLRVNNVLPDWMVVCPECGNKRCPRAASHENACSGSNEPGQDGSEK